MKTLIFALILSGFCLNAFASDETPVISANGFICGKKGVTVTCKGPIPGGNDTVTGTGHDIIYLTINTLTEGKPTRFTYFSDTGCLIGYTFNAAGNPVAAIASHRNGTKKTFQFGEGKYDPVLEFCTAVNPAPTSAQTANANPSSERAN